MIRSLTFESALPPHNDGAGRRVSERIDPCFRASARVQSQQLPAESQVFENEVLPGTEGADHPAQEMSERRHQSMNITGAVLIRVSPNHPFCRCRTFWRDTGFADYS
jgi:hypothetical protein